MVETTEMMYSPLESVFASTMDREGKTLTVFSTGETFRGFFRRFDNGQSTEDRITVYYGVDAPVEQGSLISYGNKTYILINKETEENTCYYKSYGIATNGTLALNDGTIYGIPVYGYDMKNGLATDGSVFSVVDGNMEFITEITDTVKGIEINDTFNIYGRTFKVENIYYKDGMFHIIAKVTTDESATEPVEPEPTPTDTATIYASTDTIKVGGSYKSLTVKWYDTSDTEITDTKIEGLTQDNFVWTCSVKDGEDNVDLTSTMTWLNGSSANIKKIKYPDDRSYLTYTLTVKCVITFTDGTTQTATKDFEIVAS